MKKEIKLKVMISQPMRGLTDQQIKKDRDRAIRNTKEYELVNTLFTDEWYNPENMKARGVRQIPICFLAKSIENMSLCDVAYFVKGWEKARGCIIEHDVATAYGMKIIDEEK